MYRWRTFLVTPTSRFFDRASCSCRDGSRLVLLSPAAIHVLQRNNQCLSFSSKTVDRSPSSATTVSSINEDKAKQCRIFVGNLPWNITSEQFHQHIQTRSGFRVKQAQVFVAPHNGRSKGCGVVEFETVQEAQQAIFLFHDTEFHGRVLFARPDHGVTSRQTDSLSCRRVYVTGLGVDIDWPQLRDHMNTTLIRHLPVARAQVLRDEMGRSRCCGVVTYTTQHDAEFAVQVLNGSMLRGHRIFVRPQITAKQQRQEQQQRPDINNSNTTTTTT